MWSDALTVATVNRRLLVLAMEDHILHHNCQHSAPGRGDAAIVGDPVIDIETQIFIGSIVF